MFMRHFVPIPWNLWSQPSSFQWGKKQREENFKKQLNINPFLYWNYHIQWSISLPLCLSLLCMIPAYCFPFCLSFASFFSMAIGGISSKLIFIEYLLCVGVCNTVNAIGYIIGGCITSSWQLHIILGLNAGSVAYPFEFSSHSSSLHLVQPTLFNCPEKLVIQRHLFFIDLGI